MRSLKLSALIWCLAAPVALAQLASKPIAIKSAPHCPVALSGSIEGPAISAEGSEYRYTGKVLARNESGKQIALLIYQIELGMPTGEPDESGHPFLSVSRSWMQKDDYFFREHLLAPDGTSSVDLSSMPPFSTREKPEPVHLIFPTAEVLFVQFGDGTNWGTPRVGEDALAQRATSIRYLENLLHVRQEFGDLGLANELRSGPELPVAGVLLQIYGGKPGNLPLVAECAESMLKHARKHADEATHTPQRESLPTDN